MTLALSPHDQSLVAASTRALVSPLVATSFEEWLREVNRALKELLWADKASFMFPLSSGVVHGASDRYTSRELESYVREKLPEAERRWGLRRRSVELGAYNRTLLYGDHVREIYRSDYYNEYLVAMRAFDPLCMTTVLDAPQRVVNLYFHHDRPTGRRFGARGLGLVRMLYPAFKAGVHAAHALSSQRQRLAHLVDGVAAAVALADSSGLIVHRNHVLERMLAVEAGRSTVEAAMSATVRACLASAWRCRATVVDVADPLPSRGLRRHVSAAGGTYSVTATALGVEPSVGSASVAIVVERAPHRRVPERMLRDRYRLTPREVDVARLLGQGASNDEIARSLAISRATARHHTEAVMLKLGVRARARIPVLLASLPIE